MDLQIFINNLPPNCKAPCRNDSKRTESFSVSCRLVVTNTLAITILVIFYNNPSIKFYFVHCATKLVNKRVRITQEMPVNYQETRKASKVELVIYFRVRICTVTCLKKFRIQKDKNCVTDEWIRNGGIRVRTFIKLESGTGVLPQSSNYKHSHLAMDSR